MAKGSAVVSAEPALVTAAGRFAPPPAGCWVGLAFVPWPHSPASSLPRRRRRAERSGGPGAVGSCGMCDPNSLCAPAVRFALWIALGLSAAFLVFLLLLALQVAVCDALVAILRAAAHG